MTNDKFQMTKFKTQIKSKIQITKFIIRNLKFLCSLFSVLCSLLNFVPYAYPADVSAEASFQYNASGKRDPFMPMVSKEGRIISGYGRIGSIEDIKLEGIVYDPGGDSIAIINGLVLKENEIAGNIKVLRIESNRVRIQYNHKECIIDLEENREELE